jgi:DNA-binding CsgD family transcriptional regulator
VNLSPSEENVVRMVVDGCSNAEAARHLGVTEKTIKFHLTNVYAKLEVTSRAQLIVKFLKSGQEFNEFAKLMRELIK